MSSSSTLAGDGAGFSDVAIGLGSATGIPLSARWRVGAAGRAVGPLVQALEPRRLCSAARLGSDGVLVVDGTSGPNTIVVGLDPSNAAAIGVNVDGVVQAFALAQVKGIHVYADGEDPTAPGGNDRVTVSVKLNGPVGIDGGAGNDTLTGGGGNDIIFGGTGDDSIVGGAGNDTLSGEDGNDTIAGGAGADLVFGDAGTDSIDGGDGNDSCYGGPGDDTLLGGTGDDQLGGAAGCDLELGGAGQDYVAGGNNADTLVGGGGNDTLRGGTGADLLAGDDELTLTAAGGAALGGGTAGAAVGADQYYAGPQNDTLVSGGGADVMITGTGYDLVSLRPGSSAALPDFVPGADRKSTAAVLSGAAAQTVHVHLTIDVVQNGTTTAAAIPADAGAVAGGTSVARATDASGDLVFQSASASAALTLGTFFNQWGLPLAGGGLGDLSNRGAGGRLTMTVNGVANTLLGAYVVREGDRIVLTYRSR